jgi:hypothetical protein
MHSASFPETLPVRAIQRRITVKWIGRTSFKRNAPASWHPSVVPVRVSRFAIDDQTPQRDLPDRGPGNGDGFLNR